jgi:hypothetical protein
MMYRNFIEDVARKTQRAFLDVRMGLVHKRLTDEQKAAINSLPHDNITKEPENRLRKFPNDCCMDAAFVLAVIFTAISEQKGFKFGELLHIRCTPTPKTKTVMFDFHQWLRVSILAKQRINQKNCNAWCVESRGIITHLWFNNEKGDRSRPIIRVIPIG